MVLQKSVKNILVADDDRLVLSMLSKGLENYGYKTISAGNGAEALELLGLHEINIAILDVRMPLINGIAVARKIKDICDFPIIFLSAYDDEETVSMAREFGAYTYLVKPFDVRRIIPIIEMAVERNNEKNSLKKINSKLTDNLDKNRCINVAVGILMHRYAIDRDESYERIRSYSRKNRKTVFNVAENIINASGFIEMFS
ncbi:MAG: response regulator [Gammaproteobacteria bacterium]|nr:MAG: response regulator [Gammaproteobacteria bacterium]